MIRERKPGRQPLLWAALICSAGLWVGARAWRPATWWIVAVLAFALAALWFLRRRSWMAKGLSLGTWFLLGAPIIQIGGAPENDSRIAAFADANEVTITGHVILEGYTRADGLRYAWLPIDVETESMERAGQSVPVRCGVRLTVSEAVAVEPAEVRNGEQASAAKADTEKALTAALNRCASQKHSAVPPKPRLDCTPAYGARLRVHAKLHLPRNYRNPGAFDYEGYLAANGRAVLGSARAGDVELLPGFIGSRIEGWRTRMHASLVAKIHELWPPEQAALMDAMVLGEDSFLEGGTRVEFQRSGTYHVLVVSGMNLSIYLDGKSVTPDVAIIR